MCRAGTRETELHTRMAVSACLFSERVKLQEVMETPGSLSASREEE